MQYAVQEPKAPEDRLLTKLCIFETDNKPIFDFIVIASILSMLSSKAERSVVTTELKW